MKLLVVILAACGGGAKPPAQDPRAFPIEAPLVDAAVVEEDLPFVPVGGGGEPTPRPDPVKITGSPGSSIAASDCIPAGVYQVSVDLSGAKVSQVNTGMDDLTWCKSMLEVIPAKTMATLEIKIEGKQMRLEWPPGQPQTIVSVGACSVGVTSPPMIAQITFGKNGKASGSTSYATGTPNHPDERCEAVGAKLALVKQ
jgi:hypothetical protein